MQKKAKNYERKRASKLKGRDCLEGFQISVRLGVCLAEIYSARFITTYNDGYILFVFSCKVNDNILFLIHPFFNLMFYMNMFN